VFVLIQPGNRPETTARFIPATFAVPDLYCFQEDGLGQSSAPSYAYEPSKNGPLEKESDTMKHNWMAGLVIAGGIGSAMFGQQYPQRDPQQNPPYQGAPSYNGQYGTGQRDNREYATEPGYGTYNGDSDYNDSDQGVYAPAPPQAPSYANVRPPMPGPGYYWVDGYWNLVGGRYSWVGGYWMRPPYAGVYWVAPRYSAGRFFVGFWGGGHRNFDRRPDGNHYRSQAPRQSYRSPAQSRSGFRDGDNRGDRSGNRENRGRR